MEKKNIDLSKIFIGSDIEVFLRDTTTGKFVSVIGYVGGSKDDPRPLEKDGCCVQEDNVALEYNVPAVGINDAAEMYANIQYVLDTVRSEKVLPPNTEIVCCSSAVFEPDQLVHPKAQEFGCEPDYNAWMDGMVNPKPGINVEGLRSCGGHIHISYPDADEQTSMRIIRAFDLFLGVPSILIDRDSDRRKLYGKAGAFRFKTWGDSAGFEYRTMSNWWTANEDYVKWTFNQIAAAITFVNEGKSGADDSANEINEAINNSNPDLAYALCTKYGITIPEEIESYANVV